MNLALALEKLAGNALVNIAFEADDHERVIGIRFQMSEFSTMNEPLDALALIIEAAQAQLAGKDAAE